MTSSFTAEKVHHVIRLIFLHCYDVYVDIKNTLPQEKLMKYQGIKFQVIFNII